jgi:hypothetical protein
MANDQAEDEKVVVYDPAGRELRFQEDLVRFWRETDRPLLQV